MIVSGIKSFCACESFVEGGLGVLFCFGGVELLLFV